MSEQMKDGGPAFPVATGDPYNEHQIGMATFQFPGMTLRDWFAGQAVVGLLAYSHVNPMRGNYHENCPAGAAASAAYEYADELLAAGQKGAAPHARCESCRRPLGEDDSYRVDTEGVYECAKCIAIPAAREEGGGKDE